MNIPKNAAARIEAARKLRDLTIAELSEELGMAKSSVQHYLKGDVNFRTDTLKLISEKLDIPLSELVGEHESRCAIDEPPDLLALAKRVQTIHPMLKPVIVCACHMIEKLLRVSDELYLNDSKRQGGDE